MSMGEEMAGAFAHALLASPLAFQSIEFMGDSPGAVGSWVVQCYLPQHLAGPSRLVDQGQMLLWLTFRFVVQRFHQYGGVWLFAKSGRRDGGRCVSELSGSISA